jgi:hypothetical protein
METAHAKSRTVFAWRAMTSTLIASSFLVLVFTGFVLFISPPGRVANWTNWSILGLRKHDWIGIHIWFSLLFLVCALAHLFFNWRPLLNYFKDRVTRRLGLRWEWVVALALSAGVYAGIRANVPPFSSLLAFNERVKESWETPRERAPIPHAELLTLAELAGKAGVDMAAATNRLQSNGIKDFFPEIIVQKLADGNGRSANDIYQALLSSPRPETAVAKGQGHGAGGGGYGGGKGGGPGRKTLAEFCNDEKIDLKDALARLQAKGIKATPELTMREIAVNNGYDRPYELLDILRTK